MKTLFGAPCLKGFLKASFAVFVCLLLAWFKLEFFDHDRPQVERVANPPIPRMLSIEESEDLNRSHEAFIKQMEEAAQKGIVYGEPLPWYRDAVYSFADVFPLSLVLLLWSWWSARKLGGVLSDGDKGYLYGLGFYTALSFGLFMWMPLLPVWFFDLLR